MKLITSLSVIIAATFICNGSATSVGSPHIVGCQQSKYLTMPEVFDLNLYKNNKLIRTCKGAQLARIDVWSMWITAAECLDKTKYDIMEVKYHLKGTFYSKKYLLSGNGYHIHPQYNETTGEHNIALMRNFISEVGSDPCVRGMKLPKKGENTVGQLADVYVSWKNITQKNDIKHTYVVNSLQTKVIDPSWCRFWYRSSPIKNNNICVSGWYWKGLSKNDVGIPLVVKDDTENFKIVGIANGVRTWTHWFGLPIEFLNIEPYIDWIRSY